MHKGQGLEAYLTAKPCENSHRLVGSNSALTVAGIAALGVRHISVGGAMARAAWGGFMRPAQMLAEHGKFDGFADAASGEALNLLIKDNGV